MVFHSFPE